MQAAKTILDHQLIFCLHIVLQSMDMIGHEERIPVHHAPANYQGDMLGMRIRHQVLTACFGFEVFTGVARELHKI